MASPFNLKYLKHCDKKTTNVVNGYIHEAQKLFPWTKCSYFIIPQLVNQICLSFYWIRFTFNKEFIGDNLKFLDEKTITKINKDAHSLCAIGESISGDMCDIFRIEYLLKDTMNGYFCSFIGFCGLPFIDSSTNINWGVAPGYGDTKISSVGMSIDTDRYGAGRTWIYRDTIKINMPQLSKALKKGNKFMFEFNFVESKCQIYYNGEDSDIRYHLIIHRLFHWFHYIMLRSYSNHKI